MVQMKIVQIKGSNGSGKTTIVKQLLTYSNAVVELADKRGVVYATVMEDIGWVAVGKYPSDSKMGGCDTMHSVGDIKAAINKILCKRPGFWIVFEGMMISTIKSTFYDYLLELMQQYEDVEPLFVILATDVSHCIERITDRGTMRPSGVNVDNVRNKCEMIIRHAKTYDPKYVRWMYPDKLPIHRMATEFLWCVGDTALLDDFGVFSEYMSANNGK